MPTPTPLLQLHARLTAGGRERGDVPGWVMVTVMTALILAGLMLIAQPRLEAILDTALSTVEGL